MQTEAGHVHDLSLGIDAFLKRHLTDEEDLSFYTTNCAASFAQSERRAFLIFRNARLADKAVLGRMSPAGSAAGAHHEFNVLFNAILGEVPQCHLVCQCKDRLGQMIDQDRLIFFRHRLEGRKFR